MHTHSFRLVPFVVQGGPICPATPAIEITGMLALEAGALSVLYDLSGAAEQVRYAAISAQPSRKNDLWRTTCFELFVKLPGGSEYWEYNLSPSRDWNAYHFTGYRSQLQPEVHVTGIDIVTEVAQARLASLQARLPLPPSLLNRKLAVGISSVIEDAEGNMHYFALRHSGVKPDFHDPAGFVLSLEPVSA